MKNPLGYFEKLEFDLNTYLLFRCVRRGNIVGKNICHSSDFKINSIFQFQFQQLVSAFKQDQ